MKPERWREIDEILQSALERAETERRVFLDTVCATDVTLRREVENYLAAHQRAGDFLDTPAIELVAAMVADDESERTTLLLAGASPGASRRLNQEFGDDLARALTADEQWKAHVFSLYTGEVRNPEPPANPPSPAAPRRLLKQVAPLLLAALLAQIGIGAYLYATSDGPPENKRVETPIASERLLIYSLTVQRDLKLNPGSEPFDSTGAEITFKVGDRVRMNVSSPHSGYLYIINEGPAKTGDQPEFNVLFPDTTFNGGSAQINSNQTIRIPSPSRNPERDWFIFDKEEGVEKIWLIWSEQSVPELEAVKAWADEKYRGNIANSQQARLVALYLAAHSSLKHEAQRDESNHRTSLKSQGALLVSVARLEHK